MQLHGGIRLFSQEEMFRIHRAMMDVLADVGVEADLSDASLERLARAGLSVDLATRRVRFPVDVILETVQQLSGASTPEVTLEGTAKPPQPLRAPRHLHASVGAYHGFVYDIGRRVMRPATHRDMLNFLKVKRHLPDVDVSTAGICPQDVPQRVASVHAAAVAAKYCVCPSAPEVEGTHDLPWVERVMEAAGAWEPGRHRVVPIYPVSPLRLAGRGAEMMEYQAARGDLDFVIGMVIPGASSPITLVSQTVIVLAEEFGFNTIYRLLVDPPNNVLSPRCLGDDVCIMDMRHGAYALSGPEVSLLRLATHQMSGEFYKLLGRSGHGIRFFPDAQEPGIQAAMEGALMAMSDLCQGVYSYDEDVTCNVAMLGSLGGNLSLCLEEAIIDHEMFRFLQRFVQGMRVDEEALAVDVIGEIGPGGSFLATDHTARNVRREMWFPRLWHRGAWDAWVASGRRDALERASEQVNTYLAEDLEPVLDEARLRDVDRVVRDAELALLGTATGVTA